MYGMLIESVQHFVQLEFGDEVWEQVLARATDGKISVFNTHQVYSDTLIPSMAAALSSITGESFNTSMQFFGRCFVRFFTNFGYDELIKATGRYFSDFLMSVDNIHLQMRFSYIKMKSPSIELTDVDENGAILVYKSVRTGYSKYLMGQLYEIAESFFNLQLKITVLEDSSELTTASATTSQDTNHVVVKYRLDFDNRDYVSGICFFFRETFFYIKLQRYLFWLN